MNLADLRRKVESLSSTGGGVIIYAGDLKWTVDERETGGSRERGLNGYSPVDHLVVEIGRLVSQYNVTNKVSLIGTANYQTFMKCKMKHPSLELQWSLQAVSVPSGGLGLSLNATTTTRLYRPYREDFSRNGKSRQENKKSNNPRQRVQTKNQIQSNYNRRFGISCFHSLFAFEMDCVDEERNAISEELVRKHNSLVKEEEELKKLDKLYKDLTKEVQGLCQEKQAIEKQRTEAVKKHTEVELDVKEQRFLWGTESEHTTEIKRLKMEVVKAEKSLAHATPRDIRRGMNCIPRICREHKISGVFGLNIELVECDEDFFMAVEITVGNRFHWVLAVLDMVTSTCY